MARIVHPRPKPGRQKFLGVVFHDGFAEFDLDGQPHLEAALIQHGYRVEKELVAEADPDGPFEQLPPADDTVKVSKPRKTKTLDATPYTLSED